MIIYVDIDHTITRYLPEYNNKGDYNKALPIKNRIEKINKLFDQGNTIIYWTARGTMTGINWFQITLKQLQDWGCKFNELRMNKPAYDLFIDDKNINSETFFKSD